MTTHLHLRSSSHPKRPQPPDGRSSRPLATNKRHSSDGLSTKTAAKIIHKADEPDEDAMAASFLQYCTYCEKQIMIPTQSVLYCSESCRKKDNSKALSYYSLLHDASPPLNPAASLSFEDLPHRHIVPQRSPTALSATGFSSCSELPEDDHFHSEDERRPGLFRRESEAARYLRQFHKPSSSSDLLDETPRRRPRPRHKQSSTSIAGSSTSAPSLSHSPISTDTAISTPYTPSTRPLAPRSNPFSSSCGARNTDLVNPFAVLPPPKYTTSLSLPYDSHTLKSRPVLQTPNGLAEAELMSYEKTTITSNPVTGSLRQLFSFSDMQAPPSAHLQC